MPFKKTFKKPIARPRRRKIGRRGYKKPNGTLGLYRNPFPPRVPFRLTYATGNIGDNTTTAKTHVFLGNSLFEADFTLSTGQPRGRDQLATLYANYKVTGIRYDFLASALTLPSYYAIGHGSPTIIEPTADYKSLAENPRYKIYYNSPTNNPTRMRGYLSTHAICNMTKREVELDDTFSATFANTPTNTTRLILMFGAQDDSTTAGHWIVGKITYYGVAYGLRTIDAS